MRCFHFHEAMEKLIQSFLSPYFLLPVVLVGVVSFLHPVQTSYMTGLSVLQVAFSSSIFAVCLVSAASGARFFSCFWGADWFRSTLLLPVRRSSGFWQVLLAQMFFSALLLVLTWAAVAAALIREPMGGVFPTVCAGLALVVWTSGLAALAGLLTTPVAASILAASVAGYSMIPLVDPGSTLFSPSLSMTAMAMPSPDGAGWPAAGDILLLLGQGLGFVCLAMLLYHFSLRMGIGTNRR
jgi:hypothetical protein